MSGRFAGQTVVVTGASRGLGRAIATAFGREGAFVYVGYAVRDDQAAVTLAGIREAGGEGAVLGFDVSDGAAVEAAFTQVLAERGRVDVLVSNAGVAADAPVLFMDQDDWDRVLDVNLGGTYRCCRAAMKPMLARGRGAIVAVGSVAGMHASPGQANYAASKGGILALVRTLAAELAPRGVRVNAVVPGLLSTGIAERLDRRIADKQRERIPLGRFGTGEEVADAVLFLASEQAAYLVGQALVVDGGLTL